MITGSITTVAAIALLSSPLGEAAAQERSPLPPPLPTDWRITFGTSSGRVHENVVRYTVTDRGQLAYVDKRGVEPAIGSVSRETARELTSLVDRLQLFAAKGIPSNQINACIVSPHLPNVWFTLRRGGRTYSLSHCNSVGPTERPKRYEYTLDLDAEQKEVYKTLRAKLESLFDADLKAKVGTRQQTLGDAQSGLRCRECRSDHACALVAPMGIRDMTGRNDVALYAPEAWQSETTSDCFHQNLIVSVRLFHRGWTAERLEAQREQAERNGYHVQRFGAGEVRGYIVSHAPMVATTGPYTGETAFVLAGEKLLAISAQTFPEDYLELPERDSSGFSRRGNIMALAVAAAKRAVEIRGQDRER